MTSAPLIECRNLVKWYSGVQALKGVSLAAFPGEIVGLVGDNGAGKSTLIKIISGVHRPDSGEILISGKPVSISTPKRAMKLGVETIYQYNSVVPTMSVSRNLFIGREPTRASIFGIGIMDMRRMHAEAADAMSNAGLHLRSPDAVIAELSGGQRQGVAIARAMHFKSKILILDEPTNHLSVRETKKTLSFIMALKEQNIAGIFVSHNINHIFQCADRIIAMALREVVLDKRVEDTSEEEVSAVL